MSLLRTALPLTLLALSACGLGEGTGPKFDAAKQYGLVVYRPGSYIGTVHRAYVKLNGQKLCSIGNGEFASANVAGPVALTASKYQLAGMSEITTNAPAYVRIEQRNPLAGVSISNEDAAGGPFIFTVVPEVVARKELKGAQHMCLTKEAI